nr:reverse transcriptase domain-containing protein [Tanacetum cinerariifolium]
MSDGCHANISKFLFKSVHNFVRAFTDIVPPIVISWSGKSGCMANLKLSWRISTYFAWSLGVAAMVVPSVGVRIVLRIVTISPFTRTLSILIADQGNEEDGPDSRARGDRFYHNCRSADRGNEKVDRDPGNISEIKGLRGLEIQHEIRQIRKRIQELELQREMRKETESRYVVRDDVNEKEEFDEDEVDIDEGERLFLEQALSMAPSKSIDDDLWRQNNIFRTKYNSKDKVCNMINDGGSCENAVSTYMVEKLALKTVDHPEPYQFTWLKKRIKVSKRRLVEFSARRKYKDKVWCEVIPMDARHILLGFKKIKVRGRIIIMKRKLMQRILDLEIQHEIRQIRKRIRELELQREMRKETESRYVVRDDVNEEEEYPSFDSYPRSFEPIYPDFFSEDEPRFDEDEVDIDEGERLFLEQALRWILEGVPMARNDGSIFTFYDIERNEGEKGLVEGDGPTVVTGGPVASMATLPFVPKVQVSLLVEARFTNLNLEGDLIKSPITVGSPINFEWQNKDNNVVAKNAQRKGDEASNGVMEPHANNFF